MSLSTSTSLPRRASISMESQFLKMNPSRLFLSEQQTDLRSLDVDAKRQDLSHPGFPPQATAGIDVQRVSCLSHFLLLLTSQTSMTRWKLNATKEGNKLLIGQVDVLTSLHLRVWGPREAQEKRQRARGCFKRPPLPINIL